jgi:hypothetical protein
MDDGVPFDHAIDEENIDFTDVSSGTRNGFVPYLEAGGGWNGVCLRAHVFERVGEAPQILILDDGGNIYSSISFASPILTFASPPEDFAIVSMYGRCYICPHTGLAGATAEKVYVYTGTGVAREAGGAAPTGHTLAGVEVADGKMEKGTRLFAICYLTDTSHYTPPGLETADVLSFETTADNKKLTISGLNKVGIPSYITHVRVIATPVLGETYNGNPKEQSWYFVPDALVTTGTDTVTVDFYDADLIASADYLQYQKSTIPAGCALVDFNGRMIVIGDPASSAKPWVSSPTECESFSDLDGYMVVEPGEGGACRNAASSRGILYITKSQRIYSVEENGASPTTWTCSRLDAAMGAEANGLSKILNSTGTAQDAIFLADRSGIFMFPNQVELTWKIRNLWNLIYQPYFYKVQLRFDPIRSKIYANLPLGSSTECNYLLVGDFSLGLSKENIRWSLWTIYSDAAQTTVLATTSIFIMVDNSTKLSYILFGSSSGSIYRISYSARRDQLATSTFRHIKSFIRLGFFPPESSGNVNQLTEVRYRIKGYGTLTSDLYGLDDSVSYSFPDMTLATSPGKEILRPCNLVNEKGSLKLTVNGSTSGSGHYFVLFGIRIDTSPIWASRPR